MDEQMLMKRNAENAQYVKAVKVGEWIGKRLRRMRGMLVFARKPTAQVRARPA